MARASFIIPVLDEERCIAPLLEGGELGYNEDSSGAFATDVMHSTQWGGDSVGNITVGMTSHYVATHPNDLTGTTISLTYSGYGDSDGMVPLPDAELPVRFGAPEVLVHGDFHELLIDNPLGHEDAPERFTRVQTFGWPDVGWVKVEVTPNSREPFAFHPHLVPDHTSHADREAQALH